MMTMAFAEILMHITMGTGTKRKQNYLKGKLKQMKNFISKIVLALALSSLFACGQRETVVQQPAPIPQQVVYQDRHMNGSDVALVAAGVVAGAVVADYLIGGQPRPGYVIMDGRVYRDTPQVRQVYNRTTVVNKTYVINKTVAPAAATPTAAQPAQVKPVAPVAPVNQKSLDQKTVKASADAAAEAEKVKMKAEQEQKVKQAQLKADLQAKQAARAQAKASPAPAKTGGFNSMSRSASPSSSESKRR